VVDHQKSDGYFRGSSLRPSSSCTVAEIERLPRERRRGQQNRERSVVRLMNWRRSVAERATPHFSGA
jgi:hypothetical protein